MLKLSLINPQVETESDILNMIQKDPHLICEHIEQTEERCLIAVQQSGELLEFIPKGRQTYRMCMAAIGNNMKAFAFASKKLQTHQMCEFVLSKDGMLLEHVANEIACEDLCKIAIENTPHAVRFVPYRLLTKDIILCAANKDCNVLKYVPSFYPFWDDSITDLVAQNGCALAVVPDRLMRKKHCLAAVDQNPLALEFVPVRYMSQKMCTSAVNRNPMAIQYVPEKFKNEVMCKRAIANELRTFAFLPEKYKSKQFCEMAVANDPNAFEFVPDKFKTTEMSMNAISQSPRLLRFVPQMLLTKELCHLAMDADYSVLRYVPPFMLDQHDYLAFHSFLARIVETKPDHASSVRKLYAETFAEWPVEKQNDKQIITISRQVGLRQIRRKHYDRATQQFHVHEYIPFGNSIVHDFLSFDEFYNYLDGDLVNANLYYYDFSGIDLSNYNLSGAIISSSVLLKNGLYDPSFYKLTVSDAEGAANTGESSRMEMVPAESVLHDFDISGTTMRTSRKLYYISDLHINHKLLNIFPTHATRYEIKKEVNAIVAKLLETAQDRSENDYMLFAGDVSFNFEIAKMFYSALAEKWKNVIVVLGNHELWDLPEKTGDISKCIAQYRELCNELGIVFLHNELLVLDANDSRHIISEDELQNANANNWKAFRNRLQNNHRLIVYGGLGFSGYNPEYNAQNGIYRNTLQTLEEDITETNRFEAIYNKLLETMSDLPIVVLTHTPRENWSERDYNPNWVYVNGHTHRNAFYCDEEKTVFSDNQIGYHNYSSIGLKFFYLQKSYDIFSAYPDGIFLITREQYLAFNKGLQIRMNFNRTDGKIHMLKRSGIYCFIYENEKNTYLLSGGSLNRLAHKDLQYYYQRIPLYAEVVSKTFDVYYSMLNKVSQAVKRFGGIGTVHGSIVDVSFFSHIFVNPENFSITPYFALSMTQKTFYPDVEALLLEHRKDLHANYIELQNSQSKETTLLARLPSSDQIKKATYVSDTGMYKLSKLVKKVQFLVDQKVIRVWDENLLDDKKQIEEILLMLEK